MADEAQINTALLTEHLQYTPLSLIDDIINSVNNLVYQGISSLENGLLSTPPERLGFKPLPSDVLPDANDDKGPEYPDAKREIEEGLHQLETLLESTVDKNFDKFEIYVLRNILSVPEELVGWIRLNHYEDISFPLPNNAPTPAFVQSLRRKVAASQTVNQSLAAELAQNEAMIAQLRSLTSPSSIAYPNPSREQQSPSGLSAFSFLASANTAQASSSLTVDSSPKRFTTNVTFALSQLPALRVLLADLRPKIATLQSIGYSLDTGMDERHQERRDYIEQRTKRRLEGDRLANVEDSVLVTGKQFDRDEVQALGKLAGMFNTS